MTFVNAPADVPGPTSAIRTYGLTKRYGTNLALDRADIDVAAGSVCGLIGPNGAGKSTLLSILATLLRPTSGDATVFGVPIARSREIRGLIGHVPDVLGVYSGITVEEYLHFFADAYRLPRDGRRDLVASLLELVDLETKRHAEVNTLSRGMKQRIGLARALLHEPKLLLLDEPASGLDPRARVELREIIAHLQRDGVTILISSHILGELEEMCSHALVIESGQVVGFEDLSGPVTGRTIRVTFADGTVESHVVAGDAAQVELVRTLVSTGREVLLVEPEGSTLERRFLELTDGRVN